MRLRTGAVNRGICNVVLQVMGPGRPALCPVLATGRDRSAIPPIGRSEVDGPDLAGSALSAEAICQPVVGGGGPRGKRPPPWQSRARVYADCRESPGLWDSLHRPGATRHPWRDAPCCGHPDRAPIPFTPPPGPTDGFEFGFICLTSKGGIHSRSWRNRRLRVWVMRGKSQRRVILDAHQIWGNRWTRKSELLLGFLNPINAGIESYLLEPKRLKYSAEFSDI